VAGIRGKVMYATCKMVLMGANLLYALLPKNIRKG
jgi:hypothetical protein